MFLSVEQTVTQTLPQPVVDTADEITITHLPNRTLYETLAAIRRIKHANPTQKIVPHIAARNLYSERELIECCLEFKKNDIETVLVIGGNLKQGRFFQSAFQLCSILKELELRSLCGVYPQQENDQTVKAKKYPSFSGGITQFCLNERVLNEFCSRTRIGVPSMCAATDLYKYMKRCGVLNSVKTALSNTPGIKYLTTKGFDTAKFVSQINNSNFHIYNFGKIESTVARLRELE